MEAYPSSRDPPSSPTSRWGRALPNRHYIAAAFTRMAPEYERLDALVA
jgi:hypothetical protein